MNGSSAVQALDTRHEGAKLTGEQFRFYQVGGAVAQTFASEPMSLPRFNSRVYADAARAAARINASVVKESEHEALLRDRQNLLDKVLIGDATSEEENRLAYVRWSLDRIEDARHGHALEHLESAVTAYELFQEDLSILLSRLSEQKSSTIRRA